MKSEGIIAVRGIRCYAFHGCLPEETKIGGEYVIDVWIRADLSKAMETDKLKHTIDYCDVQRIVTEEMKVPGNLIEHVCHRILQALKKELHHAREVKVKLTKINPPINGDVRSASVILQG
jgi:dihydroneopterin aldolase